MEKLKFTLLVLVLVLAFPVWFYAEMKKTDKQVESIRKNSIDSINTNKAQPVAEHVEKGNGDFTAMPFSNAELVNF
ncbi:MAG: hypothetical protein IPL50_09045 [Chitinophagaceae bacterium]|nr:hypothetical protein [Chitinophagaceae bacterium]